MSKKPKAVFFDLDETLVENKRPIAELFACLYYDFAHDLGADNKDDFFKALRSNASVLWGTMFETDEPPEHQLIHCFEKSIKTLDALSATKAQTLAKDMFDHFIALSAHNVVFNDGALETLAKLAGQGIITGIITNGIEQLQLGKIHMLDLLHKVDHVTVSAQARAHKPHQPVFDLALSRAKVAATDAWQVGDHATNDVAGAIRAGLCGVFYNPNSLSIANSFAELDEQPTHVIAHLNEVVELVSE